MAQETKPVLRISQMAFQAIQVQQQTVINEALTAALEADGLTADQGWRLSPDLTQWVRMVPDAPADPPTTGS